MKRITKIEEATNLSFKKKVRVAAYCRVSTTSDEQLISLETQKVHYENYIQANDEWEYAGLYFDEGITGTKKENRTGLTDMMKACEDGKVDFIITKSISRFSRNTTDCLEMVRRLLELGVTVLFEKENINTASMDSELMLTILSSMAESESVSISENEKWSIQKRFQNGTYIISYPPYGYENKNGEMVIIPEHKKVIQQIFSEALAGVGTKTIADGLNNSKVPSKKGGRWTASTINGILKNEKYTGDVILQKTFTDSSFNRHKNKGELNMYLIENHHEAIISHDDYERVQSILEHSGKEKGIVNDEEKYQKRYAFSGRIKCGDCGSTFKRRMHYKPSGPYVAWCCNKHIDDKTSCQMKFITDEALKAAFLKMMVKLEVTQRQLLKPFVEALAKTHDKDRLLKLSDLDARIEKNIEQRQILVGLMTSGVLEPAVFIKENNALILETNALQTEKEQLSNSINCYMKQAEETYKLLKFLAKGNLPQEFDEQLFLEYVNKITVVSREQVVFSLKCGLNLPERLVD